MRTVNEAGNHIHIPAVLKKVKSKVMNKTSKRENEEMDLRVTNSSIRNNKHTTGSQGLELGTHVKLRITLTALLSYCP